MMKLKAVKFSYEYGEEQFSVSTVRSVSGTPASLEISYENGIFSAAVISDEEIIINELSAEFEYGFSEEDRIFLNGYQSWTDSYEHSIYGRMKGIDHIPAGISEKYAFSQYGDYTFTEYPNVAGELHGWSYGYIRHGGVFDLIGSLSENCGFTHIAAHTFTDRIAVTKDCSEHGFSGRYEGIRLFIASGSEKEAFDGYFSAIGVKLRPEAKPIFGYTSWYRHYQDISSDILAQDLEALRGQKYKSDVFQIDDGWQAAVGDWLNIDRSKFTDGMKQEAEKIIAAGMLPGIWLAPFVCEEKSLIYSEHKDWLAADENGQYVRGGSNWSGFYALDVYNCEFREYLREVFHNIVDIWGFRLLKLDFLYAACIQPRPDKTRGQIMSDAMDLLRECAGDAFILGCGVPLASAFGKVDYCRIGCDVSLDWDDKPYMRFTHRERVSTKNTIMDSVFRRQLSGRAFLSDPDVFILRADNTSMTTSQKMALAEVNAAAGGVLFTSDNVGDYGKDELRILNGIMRLRNAEIVSAELDDDQLTVIYQLGEKLITRVYKM